MIGIEPSKTRQQRAVWSKTQTRQQAAVQKSGGKPPHSKMRDWPHSPVHRLAESGAYIVTAGTYLKELRFRSVDGLNLLCETLLELAEQYQWDLQAWAVFPNHYHFVALSPAQADGLRDFIRHLHSVTAREINLRNRTAGHKVWFDYWETHLTFKRSYYARLNYVHRNAVHHKLVRKPSLYPWCSAGWFERKADQAFYKTILDFPCDRINTPDEYEVSPDSILP